MSLLNSDRSLRIAFATAATALFAGCSNMQMGSPDAKTTATGSAAGSTTDNASSQLEKCSSSLGTVAVVEDTPTSREGLALLAEGVRGEEPDLYCAVGRRFHAARERLGEDVKGRGTGGHRM